MNTPHENKSKHNNGYRTDKRIAYSTFDFNISKATNLTEKVDILFNFWLENRGNYLPLIKGMAHNLFKEADIHKDYYTLGWCNFILGWLQLDHSRLENFTTEERAVLFFKKAQLEFQNCHAKEAAIRAINGEASAYNQYGHYEKALEKYLYSLDLAENISNPELINIIANNIAVLLINLKQYNEAIVFFDKALLYKPESSDELAIQYSNQSQAYRGLGDLKKAEGIILKSLRLCKSGNNKLAKVHSLLELGLIREEQANYKAAKIIFQKCFNLALYPNIPRIRAIALQHLGLLEYFNNNSNIALNFLKDALNIAEKIKISRLEAEILLTLAEVYESLGEYGNAYTVFKKGKEMEDILYNEETINKINIMKVQQARKEDLIYKDLYNRVNIISQIGQSITATFDINEIGNMIYDNMKELMDIDDLVIGILTNDKKNINYKIYVKDNNFLAEFTNNAPEEDIISLSNTLNQNTLEKDDYLKIKAAWALAKIDPLFKMKNHSCICSPLFIQGKTLGFIFVRSSKSDAYFDFHIDILKTLAAYIAIALENEKLFSVASELASKDYLTEISNRRDIFQKADNEFLRSKRFAEPLSVIIADIDQFKSVNDNYGHNSGDCILKEVAKTFTNAIRHSDMVGRIGGEEFLFLLPNTNINEATLFANRICKIISEEEHLLSRNKIKVTLSFGLSNVLLNDFNINEAIIRADKALYLAKKAGGNTVKTHDYQ